jgi:hypothetical protein
MSVTAKWSGTGRTTPDRQYAARTTSDDEGTYRDACFNEEACRV